MKEKKTCRGDCENGREFLRRPNSVAWAIAIRGNSGRFFIKHYSVGDACPFCGGTLTNVTPTKSGTTALTDFGDLTFTSATITARGALIYNTTTGGGTGTTDSVVVLDFGSDKTSTTGDFQIVFPTADASNAIIRIA